MTDTTTPLQPEERTEEQIAADLEWLKSLRTKPRDFRADNFDKLIGYEAPSGRGR